MKKISEIQNNIEAYLNEDNHYGTFYVENDLNEMARIGEIPKTKYEIHIEGGEGNVPHMHICQKSGKNIVLRIKLLTNEYFREKDDICNVLDTKERNALDSYLRTYFANDSKNQMTQWEHICYMWNNYNPSHMIKNIDQLNQPDYKEINK